MDKITCPSCGAEISADGTAVFIQSPKLKEFETAIDRLESVIVKVTGAKHDQEKDGKETADGDGEPFSEFE